MLLSIVWILKLLLIVQIVYYSSVFIKGRMNDNSLSPSFGILAYIEISIAIGLSITTLLTDYDEEYSWVVILISSITNVHFFIMTSRMIIPGKMNVILKRKCIPLKTLTEIKADLYYVSFFTKDKRYKVLYPIIRYDVLEMNLYRKVNRI